MKSFVVQWLCLGAFAGLAFAPVLRGQTTAILTTLHNFNYDDGASPNSGLIQGNDGNFYGTTIFGGADGTGTIYRITPSGTLTTLHSFAATDANNANADGAKIFAGLIQAFDGKFYGAADVGGTGGLGTIFQISAAGAFTVLHNFTGSDGAKPVSALIQGGNGNFYGTTFIGGVKNDGTVFQMTPAGTLTTLYSFSGSDGQRCNTCLVTTGSSSYYGVTQTGGANVSGTVFRISPTGTFATVHSFNGSDGQQIDAPLTRGRDGDLYGTTSLGGTNSNGTVYRVALDGTFATLYNFSATDANETNGDGTFPNGLIQASDGNFYGTTQNGGANGTGTIFEVTPAGVLTTLHTFGAVGGNSANVGGALPIGSLCQGGDGSFYGVTQNGGPAGKGTIFRVIVAGPGGALQFAAATAGANENAGSVTLTVRRTGGSLGAVSVGYDTVDGTALAGTDYTTASGTLNWADGDAADKTFTVPIIDRGLGGGGIRTFSIALGSPAGGASLGATNAVTVGIVDNDPATPTPTPTPGNSPGAQLLFPPDNLTVPIAVPLTLVASLNDPLGQAASVQFIANATVVGTVNVAPDANYSATFIPPSPGFFTVSVAVTDLSGTTRTTASVSINVLPPPDGESIGGIEFVGGLAQRVFAADSTVDIAAQSNTGGGTGFASVAFYADNVPIAAFDADGKPMTSGLAPGGHPPTRTAAASGTVYQAAYKLPAADKIVHLIATALTKGGFSVSSPPVALTVRANVQPPVVALVDPRAGGGPALRVGQDITVNAQVTGTAQSIARVEYYVGTKKVKDLSNPTVFDFDFVPAATGPAVLSAVVTDATGLSGGSPPLTVQIQPALPTVTLNVSGDGRAVEGGANGKVIVMRTGDTSAPLTVRYVVRGSARADVDYKALPGAATIPPGAARVKVKIKPRNDAAHEGDRVIKLKLKPSTDDTYALGADASAKVRIIDND